MIAVVGVRRSMTTATMGVLVAGGVPAVADVSGARAARYESTDVFTRPAETLARRVNEPGCVKLFPHHLLACLAAGVRPERVILTRRLPATSAASWAAAFPHTRPFTADELAAEWENARAALADADVPTLVVDADDLIDFPYIQAARIATFAGLCADDDEPTALARIAAMAAVVDPTLRHHRAPA